MPIDALVRDDRELSGVDRVGAFAKDFPLRTFLAAREQKFPCVLEVRLLFRSVVGAKHLRCAERRTVAREHIGNLALPDRDQIGLVDPVHEREEQVNTAAQHFWLVPGFAVQGDDSSLIDPLVDHSFSTIPTWLFGM